MEKAATGEQLLGPGMAISASLANYRKHIRKILSLVVPPLLLLFFLDLAFSEYADDSSLLSLLRSLAAYAVNVPMGAALMHVFASPRQTEAGGATAAYGAIAGKLPRLYLVSVLQGILVLPLLTFVIVGIADQGILCLFTILAAAVFIYLNIRWMLLIPEIVVRDSNLPDAFRNSWRKTQGNFWTVFGVYFISGILVGLAVALPTALLGVMLGQAIEDPAVISVLGNMLDDLTTVVILPYNIGINLVIFNCLTAEYVDRPEAAPNPAGGADG
jgi:hypothetical protein